MKFWEKSTRKTSFFASKNFFYELFIVANRPYLQIIGYLFVGGTAALTDWFFYWVFINRFGLHYILASFISFTIATFVNYFLSVKWVFKSGKRFGKTAEIGLVFLVSSVGLLVNQLCLALLIEILDANFMVAKVMATGVVFFWNFLIRKHLIFNKK